MEVRDFSSGFDTLVASYSHNAEFGSPASSMDVVFDEYEKTLFLTTTLEEIVKDLYTGNYIGDSFESTERLRRELESLVKQKDFKDSDKPAKIVKLSDKKYTHTVYKLPEDLLYIIYELAILTNTSCTQGLLADVYPTTHDEYLRVHNNPFRGPNNRRILRLDKGDNEVELISVQNKDITYSIRYLKKPEPIILTYLPKDLAIDGKYLEPQTCKLNESLHKVILDRAVRLALSSRYINAKSNGEK